MYVSKHLTKKCRTVINCISDISWCFSVYVKYKYCGAYWRINWWFINNLIGYYYKVNRNIFWILLIGMLVIFIALQIRIFTIKEDNIYNKLIKDDMTSGNYDDVSNIVKQTINKNYADDQTYYLSGMIMATINSKSEGMTEWERGLRMFLNQVY